ncbi:MAG: type III-B CRISPR module-associated protein Cmr5 [Cyanobacteriota bacterium]
MKQIINKEQERAKFSFEKASKISDNNKKNYKSYVKSLPMMIKKSGLGSTIAFIFAKKETGDAYSSIYNELNEWLAKQKILETEDGKLAEKIVNLSPEKYMFATMEVLEYLKWSRRFAEGLFSESSGG